MSCRKICLATSFIIINCQGWEKINNNNDIRNKNILFKNKNGYSIRKNKSKIFKK